jgi:hypothetical protein
MDDLHSHILTLIPTPKIIKITLFEILKFFKELGLDIDQMCRVQLKQKYYYDNEIERFNNQTKRNEFLTNLHGLCDIDMPW